MKRKLPFLFLSAALLLTGCDVAVKPQNSGGQQQTDPGTDPGQPTVVNVTDVSMSKHYQALKVGESCVLAATVSPSNATNKSVTWSSDDTSVATVSSGLVRAVASGVATISATSVDGGHEDFCIINVTAESGGGSQGGGSEGGEGGGSEGGEDLEGLEEVAYAPEGVVLTDYTDEMKAILSKYLAGHIPPFFFMEEMRVSYDNLGILQVRGKSQTGIIASFERALQIDGRYQYYDGEDNAGRTHVYGRYLGDSYLISMDALDANGLFTINFDLDVASYSWPADGIAELFMEEYESRNTYLPPYVYDNPRYIIESDVMSNLFIYCMGAPRTSPEEYKLDLEEHKWTVAYQEEGDYAGMYFATSRDRKVIAVFYYDGTGLMIEITHGDGENYKTWEDCTWAIDDFGQYELRRNDNLSEIIPAFPEAELYEISRDTRGGLMLQLYKHTSFVEADIFNYGMAAVSNNPGKFTFTMKGNSYWLLDVNKNFAIELRLEEYVDDLLAVDTFVGTIFDYKVYEGAIVYYGTWPEAQISTIARNINSKLTIPTYFDPNATFYAYSNYGTSIKVEICYGSLQDPYGYYKGVLEDNSWTVVNVADGFEAVDREETAKITLKQQDDMIVFNLEKYIKSTATAEKADFNFKNLNQLSIFGTTKSTWANGQVSFVIEQNTSTKTVGNVVSTHHDDAEGFLYDPLRVYKDQKVTITTTDGTLSKLEFYVTDTANDRVISGFDMSNLQNITIQGATFDNYNATTGRVRFIVDANVTTISFVVSAPYMASNGGIMLTSLDVFMNA